jgi:hypothetical protein
MVKKEIKEILISALRRKNNKKMNFFPDPGFDSTKPLVTKNPFSK